MFFCFQHDHRRSIFVGNLPFGELMILHIDRNYIIELNVTRAKFRAKCF